MKNNLDKSDNGNFFKGTQGIRAAMILGIKDDQHAKRTPWEKCIFTAAYGQRIGGVCEGLR